MARVTHPTWFLFALCFVAGACLSPDQGDDDGGDDDDSADEPDDDDDAWDDDDAASMPEVVDPAELVGGFWFLDLSEAEYIEPPNMRLLLAVAIGDLSLLVGVTEDSDLDAGLVHILGALGDGTEEPIAQDLCRATQPFTAGPDGDVGTADDRPGRFENPAATLTSFDYDLVTNGTVVPLTDVRMQLGFTPDGQGVERGRLLATMDTRPIATDILNNEDPYAACAIIYEASERSCFECGGDAPGSFCIALELGSIPGPRQEGTLVERRCEQIIAEDLADTGCDGRADDYTREGVEGYPLCPAHPSE